MSPQRTFKNIKGGAKKRFSRLEQILLASDRRHLLMERSQRLLLLLGLIPLLLALTTYYINAQHQRNVAEMLRTQDFLHRLEEVITTVGDAERGQRGYLITHSQAYLQPYEAARRSMGERLRQAEQTGSKVGVDPAVWRKLKALIEFKMGELAETIRLANRGDEAAAVDLMKTDAGRRATVSIVDLIRQVQKDKLSKLAPQADKQLTTAIYLHVLIGIAMAMSVVLVLLMLRLDHMYVEIRDDAEISIRQINDELEARVAERTAELEARKREVELQAAELRRSNADLTQFASIASHDLQEPLRMVGSYVGMLDKRYSASLDETARTYMQFAISGANRMQALIKDLLAYSTAGTQSAQLASVALENCLKPALADLQLSIEESHASIEVSELPTVWADAAKLKQVFQNLIANAIKFSKAGESPVIQIQTESRGDGVAVFVKDNGIGFDSKYSDRIFRAFQRLHGVGKYAGNGIGLAICRRIVEHHGGEIWADSRPGIGSTFGFTLPARAPQNGKSGSMGAH